jgi:autotransporter-associated beta strand protein
MAAVAATIGMVASSVDAGLTHRYSFNDDTANDSVGGANGVFVNPSGSGSISGGQVNFGNTGTSNDVNTNNYVDLPNNIAKTASFTVEGWASWGGGNDWQRVFDFGSNTKGEEQPGDGVAGYNGTTYFMLTPRSGNDPGNGRLRNYNGEISQNGSVFLNARNAQGQAFAYGENDGEHTFALTYDKAALTFSLYYDGALVARANNVNKDITAIDQVNMWLGRSNWQGDPFFNGSINEFRIYDNAISSTQAAYDRAFGPDSLGPSGINVWQTAGSGNFTNTGSWSLGHTPMSSEEAQISNGANVTVNSDAGSNAITQITNGTLTIAPGGLLTNVGVDLAPGNGPGSSNLALNGGTLTVGLISVDNGTTGGTGAKTITFNGGTLAVNLGFDLAGTNLTTSVGAGGATIDTQNGSVVNWGPALTASVPGATLTKLGTGVLNLQGGGFAGPVTISAGTLAVAGDVGTATSTLQLGDPTVVGGDSATLAFTASGTLNSPLSVGSSNGFGTYGLNVSGSNTTVLIPKLITLNQALTITTAASGTNGVAITGGITSGTADFKTLTFNNAGNVAVSTVGISDGAGGVVSIDKTNSGVLFLNAPNTYSGTTTIDGGGILFAAPNTIGGTGPSVTVNLGGVAAAGPGFTDLTNTFFNRIDQGSLGVLALTTNTSENINFDTLGLFSAYLGAATNVTYTGTFTPSAGTYHLGGGGGVLTLPNANALTSFNSLVVGGAGGGTVVLGAANDFGGGVNIRDNNALSISDPASLGTGTDPILFNNGILQITGTTPVTLSRPLTIDSGGGTVTVDNTAGVTLTGGLNNTNLPGNNSFHKRGLGNLTLTGATFDNGNNSIFVNAGTLTVGQDAIVNSNNYNSIGQLGTDNGTLIVQANAQYTDTGDFNISDVGNSVGYLFIKDTATVNANTLYVGKFNSTMGTVVQTGGSMNGTAAGGDWRFGGGGGTGDVAAIGTYDLVNGTLTTSRNWQIGAFGTGGMTITNGTVATTGGFPVVGRFQGGYGNLTISGGSFTQGSTGQFMIIGEQGTGVLNVNGTGTLEVQGARLRIGHTNLGNGIVNLGTGGLIKAAVVDTAADTNGAFISLGNLNFHGGTLQATAPSDGFVNVSSAMVWPEGGVIDSNGNDITIARPLIAPTGSGVSGIAVANGGTAYVGTPVIKITGGDGTGATAVPVMTGGQLTGIQITNPGVGYTVAPMVQVLGGGGSSAAAGAVTLAANASGGITKNGLGTLTLSAANTYTGDSIVNGGTLRVTGSVAGGVVVNDTATFDAAVPQTVKTLTVNAGGLTTVSAGPLKVGDNTSAQPLTVAATGKVDVQSTGLVVDYASTGAASDNAAVASVRNAIISGYSGGTWTGNGITSSTAAASASNRAVGYALASEVLPFTNGTSDTFLGTTVDKSTVVARYTLAGDATLDGSVDFNDLVKLAQNYNTTVKNSTESWWNHGDFTYDGITDFNDLVKLAQNYNTALPTEPIPGAPIGFEADLARAFASVPEPGTLSLLGLAGAALVGRRRRRSR